MLLTTIGILEKCAKRPCFRNKLQLFICTPSFDVLAYCRGMSEKALGKGSQCPPLKADQLRLYGMRFCPYVKRVRLVLAEKNIPFETVNINLTEKPEWYLERFPEGKVPALVQNDKVLFESLIIADYLDDIEPSNKLHPNDPYKKAADRCLLSKFSKITDYFVKAVYNPQLAKEVMQDLSNAMEFLEKELKSRESKYLGGDRVNMLDLMVWPWFEMLLSVDHYLGPDFTFDDVLPESTFPCLTEWVTSMKNYPSVKQLLNIESHNVYADSVRAGDRDYNAGL